MLFVPYLSVKLDGVAWTVSVVILRRLGSRGGCNGGRQDTRHDGFPPTSHVIPPWLLKSMK